MFLTYLLTAIIITFFVITMMWFRHFQNEFGKMLNIVGSLKFRVFEHEAQLLNRTGVYVPEDSAEFVFNNIWSMLSEKEQTVIKEEYSQQCPSHIPLWKYVLYNYRAETKLTRKEPYMRIDSEENILLSNIHEMEQKMQQFSKATKNIAEEISKIELKLNSLESDRLIGNLQEVGKETREESA